MLFARSGGCQSWPPVAVGHFNVRREFAVSDSMIGFWHSRQRRQDSSAKSNALVTSAPPTHVVPALNGQNSDVCCPFSNRPARAHSNAEREV
jgi:hypothetical protein